MWKQYENLNKFDLRNRKIIAGEEIDEDLMPAARLLDLRKAYPRVNRPALWGLLKKYGMGEKCLKALQGLHEETNAGSYMPWAPAAGGTERKYLRASHDQCPRSTAVKSSILDRRVFELPCGSKFVT